MKKSAALELRPGYGPRPAVAESPPRPSTAQARVLEALRASPTGTIANLERATGLHGNTLRNHLDGLVSLGLARRTRATPTGRGRPAWVYEAIEAMPGTAAHEYAGLAGTLAAHLHRTSTAPWRDAVQAGRAWGRDLARRSGSPATGSATAARHQVLAILEEVGFAPEPDARATTARLPRCPLLDTAKEYPDVVCGVHLGIVKGALDEYGADSAGAELFPFAEPGACRLNVG